MRRHPFTVIPLWLSLPIYVVGVIAMFAGYIYFIVRFPTVVAVCGWILLPLLVLAAIFSVKEMLARDERNARLRDGRCVKCGYDMRYTPSRCPECGAVPKGQERWYLTRNQSSN